MEIHCDGYLFLSNPSPIGGGWTIALPDGSWRRWVSQKPGMTVNEVELRAVLYAVMLAEPGSTIVTDSQNTVRWIEKGKCAARPDLTTHASNAHALIEAKRLTLEWRPRAQNLAGQWNETQRPELP